VSVVLVLMVDREVSVSVMLISVTTVGSNMTWNDGDRVRRPSA